MDRLPFVVLVVDDSDAVVSSLVRTLSEMGCDVDTATNGKEALDAISQRTPDLILMDLYMPVMDGLSATKALRRREQEENNRRIPVVAMSAAPDKQACDEAGTDELLNKPVNSDALRKLIIRWRDQAAADLDTNGCGPKHSPCDKKT